ncbi:MAG: hypothetical protein IJ874_07395 [Ruminococcus sp.]|nr:hypothetical protein [Ruminococcus sp.]
MKFSDIFFAGAAIAAAALVLSGCGSSTGDSSGADIATADIPLVTDIDISDATEPYSEAVPAETTATETAAVTSDEVTTETETPAETTAETTETSTAAETDTPAETTTAAPGQETDSSAVKAAYRSAIESRIDQVKASNETSFSSVTYALHDMDKDGIPELIVKYGTCEADYLTAIYTWRDGAVKTAAEGLPGGHTSYAFDYTTGQLVFCEGHMGYGNMTWYDLDENGNAVVSKDLGGFTFGPGADYEYSDYLTNLHISWITISEFMGDDTTWVISYPEGEYYGVEYSGRDFTYLENYDF